MATAMTRLITARGSSRFQPIFRIWSVLIRTMAALTQIKMKKTMNILARNQTSGQMNVGTVPSAQEQHGDQRADDVSPEVVGTA